MCELFGFTAESKRDLRDYLFECEIGLEKESLRVDKNGRFAQTEHPFLGNPNIDRDFCENQVEIITTPMNSAKAAYDEIKRIRFFVQKELKKQEEYLWLFSNPPYFENEEEIPVAHFTGSLSHKEKYRRYLAEKYGKRKMLYSGIHYNFSFGSNLLNDLFRQSGEKDFQAFVDALYLELSKKVVNYSWLIVYLTAASPFFDSSFFTENAEAYLNRYASARCSEIGYRNHFIPILDYTDMKHYIASYKRYISNKEIISESELYYPVRLKPKGANSLITLEETGVNHIEFRMLDLNPLSEAGIFEEDIAFIHMLLIYLLAKEDFKFTPQDQKAAIERMHKAALYDDSDIKQPALEVLEDMLEFFEDKQNKDYADVINYQIKKITDSSNRYAEIIRKQFGDDYNQKGLMLAKGEL